MTASSALPIGILSASAGNCGSVQRALTRLGIPSRIIAEPAGLDDVSGIIFPGAGAAGMAMRRLREKGWDEAIRSCRKPFLGICLGMQLLFDFSEENSTECLGILKGRVTELPASVVKPHMGWNLLCALGRGDSKIAASSTSIGYAYFVHSYVCEPDDPAVITMTTQYGGPVCAGVQQDNFFGAQWHPEKSGDVGDRYLLSFAQLCR